MGSDTAILRWEAQGRNVISSVLIPLIGDCGTALILLLVFLWRARIALAASTVIIAICWV